MAFSHHNLPRASPRLYFHQTIRIITDLSQPPQLRMSSRPPEIPKVSSSLVHLALRPLNQLAAESQSSENPPPYTFDPDVQRKYERKYVQLIMCDHEYCPHLSQLYMDLFQHGAELFFKKDFEVFQQCRQEQEDINAPEEDAVAKCMPLFDPILKELIPITDRHLQIRRERYSSDPLASFYNPFSYQDELWFDPNSALNLWRRNLGGSRQVSINDCSRFVQGYNTCMADNDNDYSMCFKQHFDSSVCEPGYNCPSLQKPMVQCAMQHNNKEELEHCFKSLPYFLPCAIGDQVEDAGSYRLQHLQSSI